MDNDIKIFGDKNFSDLSQEIYENNKLKKTQIDLLIQEVHGYIQGIEDIAIVGPIIKELMDVGIKNDDNLVTELISVIQKVQEEYTSWEIISTDSYEYSDELDMHTMDDDEIPDEILDDDEQISTSKLEENGWECGVSGGGTSVYNADSTELLEEYYELSSITIKFDDKSFTFSLD